MITAPLCSVARTRRRNRCAETLRQLSDALDQLQISHYQFGVLSAKQADSIPLPSHYHPSLREWDRAIDRCVRNGTYGRLTGALRRAVDERLMVRRNLGAYGQLERTRKAMHKRRGFSPLDMQRYKVLIELEARATRLSQKQKRLYLQARGLWEGSERSFRRWLGKVALFTPS